MMGWVMVIAAAVGAAWLVWAAAAHALERLSPRVDEEGAADVWVGLAMMLIWAYVRVVQRLRVEGLENVPRGKRAGPLVVVANHAAGVDPVLIQSAVPFEIRWMMARDMQVPALEWLWEFAGVISVTRLDAGEGAGADAGGAAGAGEGSARKRGGDSTAARAAIRYLREGGVIGVFPEGRIVRGGRVGEFMPGVGLLVSRTGAPVLQMVIDGVSETKTVWGSLLRPAPMGGARVRILPLQRFEGMNAGEIAAELRARLIAETGWRGGVAADGV